MAVVPQSFALDVTTAASLEGFDGSSIGINPCPPIAIVVDGLPIVPDVDSTWRGEMWPTEFLECAPPASNLAGLTRAEIMGAFGSDSTTVTFRRYPDGRVSLEAHASAKGFPGIFVRGERISTETYGSPFD